MRVLCPELPTIAELGGSGRLTGCFVPRKGTHGRATRDTGAPTGKPRHFVIPAHAGLQLLNGLN